MTFIHQNLFGRLELVVNIFNQVLIGFVVIFMTWYGIVHSLTRVPLHAWLCTIGYQLCLAEGIMCFYSTNPWTSFYTFRMKKYIHLVLQVFGFGCGLAGAIVMIVWVDNFKSTHKILGLTSTAFLVLNFLTGFLAFVSVRFERLIKPIAVKAIHRLSGLCGFTVGMVTYYFGIMKMQHSLDRSFVIMLEIFSLITLVLSLLGTIKSLFGYVKGFFVKPLDVDTKLVYDERL